jgi:predicted PurR-regulated permease PerM
MQDRLFKLLVAGASLVIIVAGLHQIPELINPFLLALLIAFAITPITAWFIKKRLSKVMAIILTFIILLIAGTLMSSILVTSISQLIQDAPTYEPRIQEITEEFIRFFSSIGINITDLISSSALNPSNVFGVATNLLSGVVSLLSNSFLIILLVILLLAEFLKIRQKVEMGHMSHSILFSRFNEFTGDITRYVSITALTGVINGVLNIIFLLILGVDYAVLWGVFTLLTSFIPTIGFIFSMIPPALLALIVFGWQKALIVIIGYIIINFLNDSILKPFIMKGGLKISILEVTLSLVFWTWCLGIIGGILSVPLTIAVKKIFEAVSDEVEVK